jgi:ribosomal-protein-alanine N-acetyltransferase
MTGNLRLRAIGSCDLELAAALHAACFAPGWDVRAFAELLAMPGSTGILAIADPSPVGLLLLQLQPPDAEILTLGVVAPARRQGIGRVLLAAAADAGVAAGARRLLLDVAADNAAALALYRDAGFAVINRRPAYYRRPGADPVDAIVLARALGTAGPVGANAGGNG